MKKCFPKKGIEIPHHFGDEETIIRALFHPLFINSKYKLKPQAFLPSPKKPDIEDRKRVSVYRKDYSTDSACKNSALLIRMNGQEYFGFVAFISKHISDINKLSEISVQATLDFTPMDTLGKYVPIEGQKIYTTDNGIPMHAEILYDTPVETDNPNTGHRIYADKLLEVTKNAFYLDKKPTVKDWHQEPIKWK